MALSTAAMWAIGTFAASAATTYYTTRQNNKALMNQYNVNRQMAIDQAGGQIRTGFLQEAAAAEEAYAVLFESALNKELRKRDAEEVYYQMRTAITDIQGKAAAARGTQLAQQAISGAVIGEGSMQHAIDRTIDLAAADTLATIYSGVSQKNAILTNAEFAGMAAFNRAKAIRNQGLSQLAAGISGAEASYKGIGYDSQRIGAQISANNTAAWGSVINAGVNAGWSYYTAPASMKTTSTPNAGASPSFMKPASNSIQPNSALNVYGVPARG